jgi:hypothetical protein
VVRFVVNVLDRLPKGLFLGLVLGTAAFFVSGIALSVVYWVLRAPVWAALYEEPYVPPEGPYPLESGEWLFVKLIWLISAVALGFVAAYGSGHRAFVVLLTLLSVWLLWAVVFTPLPEVSSWRVAFAYVNVPAGTLLGYLLWRRRQLLASSLTSAERL